MKAESGRIASASGLCELPSPWPLEGGGQLPQARLAWRAVGELNAQKSNAILICHALTGNQNLTDGESPRDGWWRELVGPGLPLDTDRYCVLCCNNLGGGDGSTGPLSDDPGTGRPYGGGFPRVGVGDWVKSQAVLADSLGIERFHAVVGGSLGGMQALRWALDYPERVERCVAIAAAPFLSAQNIAFNYIARSCIDTAGAGGTGGGGGRGVQGLDGLSLARMIGHVTYLSGEGIDKRFGRSSAAPDPARGAADGASDLGFEVERYLHHLARKFVEGGFDPEVYTLMTHALDDFDLGAGNALVEAFAPARCRFLLVSFDSDWRFPPARSRELVSALLEARKDAAYLQVASDKGHDSFLFPIPRYAAALRSFLETPAAPQEPPLKTGAPWPAWSALTDWVRPGESLLDLGSGEGELLRWLCREHRVQGCGVEIDPGRIQSTLAQGLNVVEHDLDGGLAMLRDQSFDSVFIGDGLHYMKSPADLLREMLRVGRQGLVAFPNRGHWRERLRFSRSGTSPPSAEGARGRRVAQFSIADFESLCRDLGARIIDCRTTDANPLLSANLGARFVLYRIRGSQAAD